MLAWSFQCFPFALIWNILGPFSFSEGVLFANWLALAMPFDWRVVRSVKGGGLEAVGRGGVENASSLSPW